MFFPYNNPFLKTYRRALRNGATPQEKLLWQELKGRKLGGFRFVRQYGVGKFILDFYCPQARLGIELDGGHHAGVDQSEYDLERTLELKELNITVLRFWNSEVEEDLEGVLRDILAACESNSPDNC